MSFILDALKKAEAEKNAGKPPEPIAVVAAPLPGPPAPRVADAGQRRLLLIGGGSVLLVLMVALTVWLLPRSSPAPAVPVLVQPPAAAVVVAAAPAPAAAEEPVFLEAPDPTASPEDAGADAASLDDLVGDESEPASEEAAAAPEEPAPAAEDELSPEAIAALSQPAKPAPKPKREAPVGVKRLRDMPPAFRTQFPQLNIDVHYYDDENPLKRFVIINGRKYRETDTLVEGPKVVEITVGGVILDQAGTRVVRGIPR